MERMTVKELMDALAEHDPEAIVYVDVPVRYLKSVFYEAFFTIEEVAESGSPKRINLFAHEPNIDNEDLNSWPESYRQDYVLREEHDATQ